MQPSQDIAARFSALIGVDWTSAAAPCALLFFTIVFIVALRWFGDFENKSEAVGADLNLATYGFASDLLVQLMQKRPVLPKWSSNVSVLVPVIALLLFNLLLYMVNLKLGKNILAKLTAGSGWQARLMKGLSIFLGIISASMFVLAQVLWG